jgi:hypothetical protein
MILNFDDEMGKKHFEFCFVGFILGGSLQQTKGMTVLRREMILFEKLESISELKPCGKKLPNGEPERQLVGGQIQIDMNEHDMLFNYLSNVPWQSGTPTRNALETIDWIVNNGRS